MNNELRDRIAKAVLDKILAMFAENDPVPVESASAYIADAILALPGIAVVELPEPDYDGDGGVGLGTGDNSVFASGGMVYDQHSEFSPAQAREIGSCWLAAAEYAEREQ